MIDRNKYNVLTYRTDDSFTTVTRYRFFMTVGG